MINTERAVFRYGQVFGAGSNSDSYDIELRSDGECSYYVDSHLYIDIPILKNHEVFQVY